MKVLPCSKLSGFSHWQTHAEHEGKNQRVDVHPRSAVNEKVQPRLPASKQVRPELHMQSPSLSGPVLVAEGQIDGGGAGVGTGSGVGGGPPSPTNRSALVSPFLKSVMAFKTALPSNSSNTAEAFLVGSASRTSAAPPDTWGQAMEVPLNV